ncbi:MAG: ATP-binding protein [Thermodesulfobacteriota bacterium]
MSLGLTIRTKLFLVILVPAVLLLFLIFLDYRNLSALGRSAQLILAKNYNSIKAAQQLRQDLDTNRNLVLTKLFGQDSRASFPDNLQAMSGLIGFLRSNITETGEEEIIAVLSREYETYQEMVRSFTAEADRPRGPEERYYRFISLTADLVDNTNRLVLVNEMAMERAEQETQRFARQALKVSVSLLVAAILFTLGLSFILSTSLSRPLRTLAGSLSQVQEGSGRYPALPVTTQDEIGFLTQEFNRLFQRLEVYDRISADKLSAEKLKVRRAEEAKARFIADLSHQLKTPMTSLSMGVGTLAERWEHLTPDQRSRLIEMAREDCVRLSALINELVDTARLEGMDKPRDKELLDLETVIRECLRPLINQAEEKGVKLTAEIAPDLPPAAIDSLRFPWVITNLAGNAVRYTDRGGEVIIKVNKLGERLVFQCTDTGTGIEKEFLPKIFDRFAQFSERGKSGTIGLGLAIVREIIEQHGGAIKVESEVGRGTTFTFWIPARA